MLGITRHELIVIRETLVAVNDDPLYAPELATATLQEIVEPILIANVEVELPTESTDDGVRL